jgi:hypothetical protein
VESKLEVHLSAQSGWNREKLIRKTTSI